MNLNNVLKNKLVRFVLEMQAEPNRPEEMKLFDAMMNEMHGQRVKDLFNYRKEGNHVVSILCNAIPPELIYALDNHIPVSVCMGGGELESYADEDMKGMCSLTRSMVGFQRTGMCVLFNVSDYVIGSDFCSCIKKASQIIANTTDEMEVFCTESSPTDNRVNHYGFQEWIDKITEEKGFEKDRLLEYSILYSELRATYKSIMGLRKNQNPPINGRNSLWIQQLFLVEEPKKLLSALKKLTIELNENVRRNIGYNENGEKKRILLISPRIMPPFTEIFRLVENSNAVIVAEQTCMGILNVNYDIDVLKEKINESMDHSVEYIMNNIDKTVCSCFSDFDIEDICKKIKENNVDAVIAYSLNNCPKMEHKTIKINELLNQRGIPSMVIQTSYLEIYEKEEIYMQEINHFLSF